MAEGESAPQNVVCRFFATSKCRDGSKCPFSHDRSKRVLDNVCRFYLQGRCVYGPYCHYDHIRVPSVNRSAETEKRRCSRCQKEISTKEPAGATSLPVSDCSARPKSRSDGKSQKCENSNFPCFNHGTGFYGDSYHQLKRLERRREERLAMQRSIGKTCGICFDVVLEKESISDRRFGILEKCNHVFCLSCIRKWRRVKYDEATQPFEAEIDPIVTRTCPECRIPSDFVTPSKYWVESKEEKVKLIREYKDAMSKKPCSYFKQGRGVCPFAGACFYLHAKPDGTKVVMPPPVRRPRRSGNGGSYFGQRVFLWDYLELRDEVMLSFDWDDMFTTDSEESDRSDIVE